MRVFYLYFADRFSKVTVNVISMLNWESPMVKYTGYLRAGVRSMGAVRPSSCGQTTAAFSLLNHINWSAIIRRKTHLIWMPIIAETPAVKHIYRSTVGVFVFHCHSYMASSRQSTNFWHAAKVRVVPLAAGQSILQPTACPAPCLPQ